MKKVIIGLSGIVLVAFIVVMVANASTGDPKEAKKATTEMSKDCSKCPSAAKCAEMTEAKKCEASGTGEAKACCKNATTASTETKKCDEAKPCCAAKK